MMYRKWIKLWFGFFLCLLRFLHSVIDLPFSTTSAVKFLFIFLIFSVNEVVKKSFPDFLLLIIPRTNRYLIRNCYPVEAKKAAQQFWTMVQVREDKQFFSELCHPSGKIRVGQFTHQEHHGHFSFSQSYVKKTLENICSLLFPFSSQLTCPRLRE